MASHSINIHSYRRVIDVNDFIDYLISERIINRQAYEFVLSKVSSLNFNRTTFRLYQTFFVTES